MCVCALVCMLMYAADKMDFKQVATNAMTHKTTPQQLNTPILNLPSSCKCCECVLACFYFYASAYQHIFISVYVLMNVISIDIKSKCKCLNIFSGVFCSKFMNLYI